MEMDLAKAGLHMLIEKPISMRPAEEVQRLASELDRLGAEKNIIIAVGYMLRCSFLEASAVQGSGDYTAWC
jgi:predicted dehydrogenase